jgi:hypothetical protein
VKKAHLWRRCRFENPASSARRTPANGCRWQTLRHKGICRATLRPKARLTEVPNEYYFMRPQYGPLGFIGSSNVAASWPWRLHAVKFLATLLAKQSKLSHGCERQVSHLAHNASAPRRSHRHVLATLSSRDAASSMSHCSSGTGLQPN